MPPCIHKEKISKSVVESEWDKLSDDYRYVIAADHLHLNAITQWFIAHCEAETNCRFNDPNDETNDSFFFGHKRRIRKSRK